MRRSLLLLTAALLIFVVTPLFTGCSSDLKHGDIITSPTDDTTNDFSQLEANATLMQTWIGRMEPYVTQMNDGTYSLDWHGFLVSIRDTHPEVIRYFVAGGQPSDDAKVIQQLKEGIPVINAALAAQAAGKAASPEGSACWNYWWGRRCCYWGDTGWQMVAWMAAGSWIRPWGYALTPFGAWAAYLMQVHGGFCANGSWAGGIWLTAP